jgi:TPR repeat protein
MTTRGKFLLGVPLEDLPTGFGERQSMVVHLAQNSLGIRLGDGDGVTRNVQEALSWLRKAFHAGHSCAASNIAITYRENGKLEAAVSVEIAV